MIRGGGIITPIDHFEQLRDDPHVAAQRERYASAMTA
jgi:hypothetical protein